MHRLLSLISLLFIFLNPQLSFSQGLLDKLEVDQTDTATEIFEKVLKPLALYDPEFVEVRVLDDLEIFKGHSDDIFPPEYLNAFQDNPMLFKRLQAMENELLLKVNVQVNLKEAYYKNINTLLSQLADTTEPLSSENLVRGNGNNVEFLLGSIKGNPRVVVGGRHHLLPHSFMNLLNAEVQTKFINNVHEPFTYYGFNRTHNNGTLCKTLGYKFAETSKNAKVYDGISETIKPAAQNYFDDVFPVVNIKFLSENNSIVNQDTIIHSSPIMRMGSIAGFGSADLNRGVNQDVYQSIITMDTKNGWHPQDAMDDTSPNQIRFSRMVNNLSMNLYFGANPNALCTFGIVKQINFSIVTKVTNEILGETERIVVNLEHYTQKHIDLGEDLRKKRLLEREELDKKK